MSGVVPEKLSSSNNNDSVSFLEIRCNIFDRSDISDSNVDMFNAGRSVSGRRMSMSSNCGIEQDEAGTYKPATAKTEQAVMLLRKVVLPTPLWA